MGLSETLLSERGITQSGPADGARGASQALPRLSARPQSPIHSRSDLHAVAGGPTEHNSSYPLDDSIRVSISKGKGTKRPASSEGTVSTDSSRPRKLLRSAVDRRHVIGLRQEQLSVIDVGLQTLQELKRRSHLITLIFADDEQLEAIRAASQTFQHLRTYKLAHELRPES